MDYFYTSCETSKITDMIIYLSALSITFKRTLFMETSGITDRRYIRSSRILVPISLLVNVDINTLNPLEPFLSALFIHTNQTIALTSQHVFQS